VGKARPSNGESERALRRARSRPIHVSGPTCDVVFAVRKDGSCPAREYLNALKVSDQDKFNALFIQMTQVGRLFNKVKFRPRIASLNLKLGDRVVSRPIAEFKIHSGGGHRMLTVQDGRQWVLVLGFQKGATLENQIERAGNIIQEDLDR
jgi:putative component of toxin-antitoxin plasmid stabilization module